MDICRRRDASGHQRDSKNTLFGEAQDRCNVRIAAMDGLAPPGLAVRFGGPTPYNTMLVIGRRRRDTNQVTTFRHHVPQGLSDRADPEWDRATKEI
jgi:hypothetical protein